MSISVRFGIGATIRIGREIQCLQDAGCLKDGLRLHAFEYLNEKLKKKLKKNPSEFKM